jgi:hypothetical protein
VSKRVLPIAAAVVLAAAAAGAQVPGVPCPEFRVNSYTRGDQGSADVAARPDGSFLVVWTTANRDHNDFDVLGQRFDPAGNPQGEEFKVNTYTTGLQVAPAVAATPDGFVVTWNSYLFFGEPRLFGQRYDADGVPQGAEFQVNTTTLSYSRGPQVAAMSAGGFVVVWDSFGYAIRPGVLGQRFDGTGQPVGPEFSVNGLGTDPSVGASAAGFVVAWTGTDGEGTGVSAQRYEPSGDAAGPAFIVNTYTTGYQLNPSIAMNDAGGFAVIWDDRRPGPESSAISVRAYDATGVPRGDAFQVSKPESILPSIAADSTGGFVTAWTYFDGDRDGVAGRRLGPDGVPRGAAFPVNAHTVGFQGGGKVAGMPNGGFVMTWTDNSGDDGSESGVFASFDCASARFYAVTPCRLADTRNLAGPSGGPPLAANSTRTFAVAGRCGVPPDARALALNVTAVNPTDEGDLRLFAAGQPAPLSSTLNFVAGRTRANNATVMVGADREISVQCDMPAGSSGMTNVLLDVYGYYKR